MYLVQRSLITQFLSLLSRLDLQKQMVAADPILQNEEVSNTNTAQTLKASMLPGIWLVKNNTSIFETLLMQSFKTPIFVALVCGAH